MYTNHITNDIFQVRQRNTTVGIIHLSSINIAGDTLMHVHYKLSTYGNTGYVATYIASWLMAILFLHARAAQKVRLDAYGRPDPVPALS